MVFDVEYVLDRKLSKEVPPERISSATIDLHCRRALRGANRACGSRAGALGRDCFNHSLGLCRGGRGRSR